MTAGKSSEKDAEKKRNLENGLSRKYAKLSTEKDHCASRWKVRGHLVVYLTELQQFLLRGLHLVGLDWTWRLQQEEEALHP